MILHVTPINELEKHEESTACKCNPRVEHINGNMVVVHNSFDGREGVEWVNEIIKTKEDDSRTVY